MSNYENHKGKLILQKRLETEVDKDYLKRVLGDNFNEEKYSEFNNILDYIYINDLEKTFFYINNNLYLNTEYKELDPYEDIQELEGNEEDGYTYHMRFYNGGTCLSEMIEDSLNKINR